MSDRIASHGDFLMPAGEGAVCEAMTASQQQSLLRASVIIPHLNEPDNLRRCLQSLEAQRTSEMPFEIIVVDNGSSELPVAACSGFDAARLEREPVPGPGPARNLGARLARSELLVFIDADCVAQPGWLRAIVVFMENNPCIDFAGGGIGLLLSNPKRPTSVEAYEHFQLSRSTLRRTLRLRSHRQHGRPHVSLRSSRAFRRHPEHGRHRMGTARHSPRFPSGLYSRRSRAHAIVQIVQRTRPQVGPACRS